MYLLTVVTVLALAQFANFTFLIRAFPNKQFAQPISGTNVSMFGGKPHINKNLSPNLLYTIIQS